jgi:DNA-binding transcriptional LysR family regulator
VGQMNNHQLKSFLVSVECGSFSKAEEKLSLSKQAIRKQISALEVELGASFLQRTNHGVLLTKAGEEFYMDAVKILDEITAATEKCRTFQAREKVIRIVTPRHPRLRMDKAFIEFSRRYPDVKQQMIMQASSRSVQDILNGWVDVAEYTYQPELKSVGIDYIVLEPLPFKCLVAPNHKLAPRKSLTVEDLSGQHIGHNIRDTALITQLKESCVDITLAGFSEYDMQVINNICFNGGAFLSKAFFVDFMAPLISIPLQTDYIATGVVVFLKSPPKVVKDFIKVVKELFPPK